MGKPSNIVELRYSAEASFVENIQDLGSNTYGTRLPILGVPTLSAIQSRIANTVIHNRSTRQSPGYNGPRENISLSFSTHWPGYMATTASGSLSAPWHHALLALGLGGENLADTGTTEAASASTATALEGAAADFADGSVLFVGSEGDGAAEGHAAIVDSTSGTTINLATALPAAPTNGHVFYASTQVYPKANYDIGTSNSVRMILSMLDTGNQWHLLGGQLASVQFNMPIGELPTIDWTYQFAWAEITADTTPSAVSLQDSLCAPWAGADVFFQTTGTTTRNTLNVSSMSLSLDTPLIAHRTTGGITGQTIRAWSRGKVSTSLDITLHDWANTYDTLFDSDGSSSIAKTILAQSCRTDGRRAGFYMRNAYIDGERPTSQDVNGVTGVSFRMTADEYSSGSGDLEKAPLVLFFG